MRENRTSGSEGGAAQANALSLPLYSATDPTGSNRVGISFPVVCSLEAHFAHLLLVQPRILLFDELRRLLRFFLFSRIAKTATLDGSRKLTTHSLVF